MRIHRGRVAPKSNILGLVSWLCLLGAIVIAYPLPVAVIVIAWGAVILLPVRIARGAVQLTEAREYQRRYAELNYVTPANRDLLRRYVSEVVTRWRWWLLLLIVTAPLLVVATPPAKYDYDRLMALCTPEGGTSCGSSVEAPNSTELAQETLIYSTALIGLLGVSLLGAAIGVKLTLIFPGHPTMLVTIFTLAAIGAVLVGTIFGFTEPVRAEPITITLLRGDSSALLPYIVGLWLLRLPVNSFTKNL